MEELLMKFEGEYLKFNRVKVKLSLRSDLHAFMLLDMILEPELCRNGKSYPDMISDSDHDKIYLSVDCAKLATVITDEQACDLVRCGIRYDIEYDRLTLFT